ncbi:hypothetical protein GCM10023196_042910 [Actinoallomurus vinaceus]|uniref:Uncharacterized protein n=1 Tax=Actinoallomurus vinaceus TaxID=1080074 RepID=A0ABP8UB54_9ACTN
MIADAGSRYGTRGTSTRPAPSMPRRRDDDRDDPVRTLRLDVLPVMPVPRLAPVTGADRAEARVEAGLEAGLAEAPPAAGSSPHTSQYPSTTVPPHPGLAQRSSGAGDGAGTAAGAAVAAGAAAAVPQTSQ